MSRILSFRATQQELLSVNHRDLTVGLFCTWIVGIGRYWDNPRVELLQHLGVGSVIYVFVLALFLFLLIAPMFPQNWKYFRVLTFVTMTSLPGLLYAIPVQMIFPEPGLETANEINLAFLGIVSLWRVSLLLWYCSRVAELRIWQSAIASAVPIVLLIVTLAILNLDRVVFNIMMGIDESSISPNDDIYMVLVMITFMSYYAAIPLLVAYVVTMLIRFERSSAPKQVDEQAVNSNTVT